MAKQAPNTRQDPRSPRKSGGVQPSSVRQGLLQSLGLCLGSFCLLVSLPSCAGGASEESELGQEVEVSQELGKMPSMEPLPEMESMQSLPKPVTSGTPGQLVTDGSGTDWRALSDDDWRQRLEPKAFNVLREAGTERANTGALLNEKRAGTYSCAGCGLPLFNADSKYKSGTGWPSFWQPAVEANIGRDTDRKLGYERSEVHCARCAGHLGHVFDDGPRPTGLRYCINSVSLAFTPNE